MIIVAEGAGSAIEIGKGIHEELGLDPRVTILGHIQRGGTPSCFDTVLASRLGAASVEVLLEGQLGKMVGRVRGEIVASPLEEAWASKRPLDADMLRLLDSLTI